MSEAELRREIQRRQRAETLQASQQRVLRLIATSAPLAQVVVALVESAERLFRPSLCALLVYAPRDDCLHLGAAPDIDEQVRALLDGTPLGPDLNAFAAAAYYRRTVVVSDIARDETCGATRAAALGAGYHSCWAHPVLGTERQLLGVIGMYNPQTRAPSGEELKVIADLAELAGLAIGHEQSAQRLHLLSSALEQTDDAVMIMDRDGAVEYVNPAYERISGYGREEVSGTTVELFNARFHEPGFEAGLWDTLRDGAVFRDVFVNRRRDGELYYEEKTITPFLDRHDQLTHFVATGKDITEHMETERRLHYLAHHDPLTGLANRALLFDHLAGAVAQAARSEHMVALLYADLDRFKTVNDSFGHSTGDQLLQLVAERLRGCVRETDTVARLGGDEFVVLLPSVRHVDEPAHVARDLIEALRAPFVTDNARRLYTSASVGIAICPIDAEDSENLLRNADQARYRAKTRGGDLYEFYAQYMTDQTARHLDLEQKLRHALARGELSLHYQPRVDARSERVCGVEALLRWRQPELGDIAALDFVPLLEETGLIVPVGRWVLESACGYARSLHSAGLSGVRVAVNLSPRQLRDNGLVKFLQDTLDQLQLDGQVLELEITENLLVENSAAALATLADLHALGVHISIDDFGTGYSSLAYLKRLTIDSLKIDRAFTTEIASNRDDQAIVRAIVAMARSLGYRTTAEGVETVEQLELLRGEGCDELQGFYFSPPLSAEQFREWLSAH